MRGMDFMLQRSSKERLKRSQNEKASAKRTNRRAPSNLISTVSPSTVVVRHWLPTLLRIKAPRAFLRDRLACEHREHAIDGFVRFFFLATDFRLHAALRHNRAYTEAPPSR